MRRGLTAAVSAALSMLILLSACGTRLDKTSEFLKYKDSAKIEQIDRLCSEYVKTEGIMGMSVGVFIDGRVKFFNYGVTKKDGKPISEETRFELGTMTQVFTGVMFGEYVARGYLNDGSTVKNYFPYLNIPAWNGENILTYGALATHRSGLPQKPSNLPKSESPYSDYGELMLRRNIGTWEYTSRPGDVYFDAGMDMGLLGFAVEAAIRQPYETLVKNAIMYRIGMEKTTVTMTEEQDAARAMPHDVNGNTAAVQNYACLQGMAGFKSTAYDMMAFSWMLLGMPGDEETYTIPLDADGKPERKRTQLENLRAACDVATSLQYEGNGIKVGYGFRLGQLAGKDYIWQSGVSAGYGSYIGLIDDSDTAVVILANSVCAPQTLGESVLSILN